MLAAGASFTICIPSAFVTFPVTNNLTSQARSRVTAAGPFHNLVFWCLILGFSRLGIAQVATFISGYKNMSSLGKVVVDVDVVCLPLPFTGTEVDISRIRLST